MKILMVCLGNICRSPMAEGIMRHKIEQQKLDWRVDSCGTGGWHVGEPPHPDGQRAMRRRGLDISHQRARQFHGHFLEEYDLICAMDSSNYNDIMRHAKTDEERSKVSMIMNISRPGSNESIPDPYYNDHLYDQVFDMLSEACDAIIEQYALTD
ncbi:MAG: low molecular weight phosphotyrosine protein phosphatase [Chitinophagales bacterium]|nr:low molecular weight phosphotyrosine protein phosphatase [Chitinophagales bacterium]